MRRLRWLVLVAWAASTVSLVFDGWREGHARVRDPHPEMPEEGRDRALVVLRACQQRVGPQDLLVVAPGDEAIDLFLHYRLAYLLYPARVTVAERSADALAQALARPGGFHRRHALVLGRTGLEIAGATPVALTPRDALYEARP